MTPINGKFKGKDILTLDQFSPKDLDLLFKHTQAMKRIAMKAKSSQLLAGNVIGLIFYEPCNREDPNVSPRARDQSA